MVTHTSQRDVRKKDAQSQQLPTIQAQVTNVRTTTNNDEISTVNCDVITRTSERHIRRVPLASSNHVGHVAVPKKNDWVTVQLRGRRGQSPVITAVNHTQDQQAPLSRPGHWRHEFRRGSEDPLYVEAEPIDHSKGSPDVVRMGLKPDGVSDPTTEVAVDDSGSETTVRIETDGDITLSAGGDIVIDEGGSATPVAKQGHTHDFTYVGSGDNSSTQSGTTNTPNENGTDVEID